MSNVVRLEIVFDSKDMDSDKLKLSIKLIRGVIHITDLETAKV